MENFSEWFHDILEKAEITDSRYPIKGMAVWLPYGFQIRRATLNIFRDLLDKEHDEVLFPLLIPEEELAKEGRIRLIKKPYEESDLEGADFVLAATNDHAVNDLIYEACKKRNITVNVSTDRSKSDFYFPGIARKGNIVVGVTASGKDHAGAGRVSELMREMLEKI